MKRDDRTKSDDTRRGGIRLILMGGLGLLAGVVLGVVAFTGGDLPPIGDLLPGLPGGEGQAEAEKPVPGGSVTPADAPAEPHETNEEKAPDASEDSETPDRMELLMRKVYPGVESREALRAVQEGQQKVKELHRLREDCVENQPGLVEEHTNE